MDTVLNGSQTLCLKMMAVPGNETYNLSFFRTKQGFWKNV